MKHSLDYSPSEQPSRRGITWWQILIAILTPPALLVAFGYWYT